MVYQNHCIVKGEVLILQMPLNYAHYEFALPIIVQRVMGWTMRILQNIKMLAL